MNPMLGYCVTFGDPNRKRTMILYAESDASAVESFQKSSLDTRIHSVESLWSRVPAWKRQAPKKGET